MKKRNYRCLTGPMSSIDLIRPYFREHRYRILAGLLSLIVVDVLQLFIPRIVKRVVDDLTQLRVTTHGLLGYALMIAALALLIGLFRYLWRFWLLGSSRRIEEGLRNRLFAHLQTLSASYFDRVKTGDLMAHATNDIQQVRMAAGMGLVALNDAVVLGAAAIAFMAYINLRLTLFVLIPMPFIVVGTKIFSRTMHKRYQDVQAAFADLTEVVRERLAGIRVIKAYGREPAETARLREISRDYVRKNLGLVRVTGSFYPMMVLFGNLSLAIVLYLGGRETITWAISPGDFVAFISYLGLLTWPMMALGWVTNLIQRGRASLDRIGAILDNQPEIVDRPGAVSLVRAAGSIWFENVAFSYAAAGQSNRAPVLDRIDFTLETGQTLGIVGPPGSGKTTLLNLLPRLYDVAGGQIRLDGRDIREIRLQNLRAQMATVPQEPFLFAGSIRDNIAFGNPRIRNADLIRAAREAAVYDTIRSLPDGFDTVVGERGIMLSGGQKQRIALARAFLLRPPIFVLDDPTSQVDFETGSEIIRTLKNMAGSHTVLIASHRLSAVRHADQLIVLENGRMSEAGTHAELLEHDGYYAQTYRLQEIEEEFHAN
jgi:ATP-binding cassette subfamily B multidrug efflux pump